MVECIPVLVLFKNSEVFKTSEFCEQNQANIEEPRHLGAIHMARQLEKQT